MILFVIAKRQRTMANIAALLFSDGTFNCVTLAHRCIEIGT